ncbi:MAG: hypothetical protein JSS91_08070 [Bacteroidetes bacterium]|nr:hypothetical protein [Bacteroidota bacterium]
MFSKKVISVMILLVALFAFSANSFSQSMPGDKAGRTADMLYKKLNLSTDQYSKVYSSLLGYYSNQDSHMKEFKKDKSACEKACMTDWEKVKTAMSGVLNKDQMAKFSGMNEKSMMYVKNVKRHKKQMNTTTESKPTGEVKKDEKKMETTKKSEDPTKKTTDTKTKTPPVKK